MKKAVIILNIIVLLFGCRSIDYSDEEITEEKAKQIIIDERSRECCEDAEVLSVTSKSNTYVVYWEIPSIDEKGKDSINKKNGEIKTIESSRGSCKWK